MTEAPPNQSASEQGSPPDPYTKYQVDVAVAKKKSDLYAADFVQVDLRHQKLADAQTKYAEARTAQKKAFTDLEKLLDRIRENLCCAIKDKKERDKLTECWKKLLKETAPESDHRDCKPVDDAKCDSLPTGKAALTDLLAAATACAARADSTFDRLAGLPQSMAATIAALGVRATALEQKIVAVDADTRRAFVEYLQLNLDFQTFKVDWMEPNQYWSKLQRFFGILLHRHVIVICVTVALEEISQYETLAERAKESKRASLIDAVLDCADPPSDPGGGGGGEPSYPEPEGPDCTEPTPPPKPSHPSSPPGEYRPEI